MNTLNKAGMALIKSAEGCVLTAYRDSVGVWTIGYGHTGRDVTAGRVINQDQAEVILLSDLAMVQRRVNEFCPVTTPNQFAALVSFAFNLGTSALQGSTLRKKHNAGDYAGAKAEFARWNHAGGKVLPGLTKRRAREAVLYGA